MCNHAFQAITPPRGYGYKSVYNPISMTKKVESGRLRRAFAAPVRRRAASGGRVITAAERRRNGASEDGFLGGVILDAFLTAAFPPLGGLLMGFGATDVVDLYTHARSAFDPKAGRKNRMTTRFGYHPRAHLGRNQGLAMMTRRPKRSVFALLFG